MSSKEIYDTEKPSHEVLTNFELHLNDRLKPSSVNVYIKAVQTFILEGNKLDDVQDYTNYLIEHTIHKRSSHYYDIMLKFVNWLNIDKKKKKEIINAFKLLRKKYHDPIKQTLVLNKKQRLEIINNMESYKHRIIGLIQEECGVRAGDVIRLKRGHIDYDVDDDEVVMKIMFEQKGGKVRTIFIFDKKIKKEIQEFIRTKILHPDYYFIDDPKDMLLFDYNKVIKMNYDYYYRDLTEACKKLGYDSHKFSTHDIRRNFAIETLPLVDNNIVELQKAMGHSDINTTIRYLKFSGLETKNIFKKRFKSNLNDY